MNRPEAIRTFFRSSAIEHAGSSSPMVDSPASTLSGHPNLDHTSRDDPLAKYGKDRLNVPSKSGLPFESNNLAVQKGLFKLVQNFLDKKDGRQTAAEIQNRERVYERCKSILRRLILACFQALDYHDLIDIMYINIVIHDRRPLRMRYMLHE